LKKNSIEVAESYFPEQFSSEALEVRWLRPKGQLADQVANTSGSSSTLFKSKLPIPGSLLVSKSGHSALYQKEDAAFRGVFQRKKLWSTVDPLDCLESSIADQADFGQNIVSGFLAYDSCRYLEDVLELKAETDEPDMLAVFSSEEVCEEIDSKSFVSGFPREIRSDELSSIFSDRAGFLNKASKAKSFIKDGDVYQLVLANERHVGITKEQLGQVFNYLIQKNPSPYHFWFKTPFGDLLGASPETYLQYEPEDRLCRMRLVAGTYKQEESFDDLVGDSKELAEHNMLIDHARNDLARHSVNGSVRVSEDKTVDSYMDLHHLVSTVEAKLKDTSSWIDLFRGAFPICTLTGTPKIRALQIIEELEDFSRGTFGGSVFYLDAKGELDSSVVIRSLFAKDGKARVRAGAGIVHDSNPEREFSETEWKVQSLWKGISTVSKA